MDYQLADSPDEPDKIIEGLTVGAIINAQMRAVNETGPGPFGEPAQATIKVTSFNSSAAGSEFRANQVQDVPRK
ncbi:MAG: hypothetical protein EXS31_14145 [Pedosphaera sp.]|nr:hypothetical protein [Pedosphaera sp.]